MSIEWLDRLPTIEQTKDLEVFLRTNFGMEVSSRRRRTASLSLAAGTTQDGPAREVGAHVAPIKDPVARDLPQRDLHQRDLHQRGGRRRDATTIQLFDEVLEHGPLGGGQSPGFGLESPRSEAKFEQLRKSSAARGDTLDSMIERELIDATASDGDFGDLSRLGLSGGDLSGRTYASRMGKMLGDDLFYEDDANAKVVFGTLRSGQRLETPFSLIVIGDVNPGADLVAGGDIVVFGSLKGTAHASAYDDDAFDRVIVALQMQPMQLRIGSVISRGSDEVVKGAEIARIENRRIIVEAFNPRAMLGKKIR